MNRLEARIRDYLAKNLNVIARDLTLVRTEFPLSNSAGAGGSIDILARDLAGHYVVIEIKRSDQTARAALHELTKYVALLKSTLGVRPDQIRALLLSTEWHELAVPFSEYRRICEVPADGYELTVASDGTVTNAIQFEPRELDQPLNISRQQFIFFFVNCDSRDSAISGLASAAHASQLRDFAIFSFDYQGSNEQVIFPFCAYFVFSSPLLGLTSAAAEKIKSAIPWDEELDDLEENFLCALAEKLEIENDDAETGYPEKLELLLQQGWNLSRAHRFGRYQTNALLLTDAQLVVEATKKEGGANHYLQRAVSPKYRPSWTKFEEDSQLVLLGNGAWTLIFNHIIHHTQAKFPQATVSAQIYNPANAVISLGKLFGTGESEYLPGFQLVVTHDERVSLYVGVLCWSGRPVDLTAERWIETVFGSIDHWMIMNHFGEQFQRDDDACARVGLKSAVIEVINPGSDAEAANVMFIQNDQISSTPLAESSYFSIADFYESNRSFGVNLVQTLASFSRGLIN